jgi:hypothetical protein
MASTWSIHLEQFRIVLETLPGAVVPTETLRAGSRAARKILLACGEYALQQVASLPHSDDERSAESGADQCLLDVSMLRALVDAFPDSGGNPCAP